jgi:acyl-CoA synthetase (AMP-forming)/AMP-acid ligase II
MAFSRSIASTAPGGDPAHPDDWQASLQPLVFGKLPTLGEIGRTQHCATVRRQVRETGVSATWREKALPLLGWLEDPKAHRGIRLHGEVGWDLHPYPDLARRTKWMANAIRESGVGRDARVAVAATDPIRFLEGFFGVLASGATPIPIAPPTLLGRAYQEYVAHLLWTGAVNAVVATDDMSGPLAEAAAVAGLAIPVLGEAATPCDDPPPARHADLALVQFTSGSTSKPRAVKVSWQALETHVAMIRRWLDWGSDDSLASWLPLYHDMGLIGGFLTTVCSQSDLWLMPPEQFIRRPLRFLRCIGENGVTISPSPTFGYAHMARRLQTEELAGTDFSSFRAAVIGAERIDPRMIASFARLVLDHGFRWEGLRPAYGLAEATLAVTGLELERKPRVLDIDWASLELGVQVNYTDAGTLDVSGGKSGSALVSCGRPLPSTTVTVVDNSGGPLPQGHLGEIVVTSPSVSLGYESDGLEGSATRIEDGCVVTGDAGFIVDDELYVIGRMTDCIMVRGQRIYVEYVEDSIAEALEFSSDKCVVTPGHGPMGEEIIATLEHPPVGPWVQRVVTVLTGIGGRDLGIKVYAAEPRSIPRTTSGKKRRRLLGQRLLNGTFDAELVYDSAHQGEGASQGSWQDHAASKTRTW